jgi:hypothetical protein
MSPVRVFELAMSGMTLISGWYIGNKNVVGQRLAVLANLMWWVYIFWVGAWGLAPMEVGFSIIVVRSLIKWERDAKSERSKNFPGAPTHMEMG